MSKSQEDYVPVSGGKVWFQILGTGNAIPLVTLHGGPGFPHDYLESLGALADERPVVFYDQLGCGKSDRPDDPKLWHTERFVEELEELRQYLGLEKLHLLGHSWGGILATEYVLDHPTSIMSLVLASPALSISRYQSDATMYRKQLPAEVQEVLDRHEAAGSTESEEYQSAAFEFYRRHICRLDPWPESLNRSLDGWGFPVYVTMQGPSEFYITGNLKGYDVTDRLGEIRVPVLLTCGRYDEMTPETTRWYQSLILGAEMVEFENSAHMPHLEEEERYIEVVRDFLKRVEKK